MPGQAEAALHQVGVVEMADLFPQMPDKVKQSLSLSDQLQWIAENTPDPQPVPA